MLFDGRHDLFRGIPFSLYGMCPPQGFNSGLEGASGSTIGLDGALYVTEGVTGEVTRVDRKTGEQSMFADNLPPLIPDIGYGGAVDVAFLDDTAYVLVSLTDPFAVGPVGGFAPQGVYRVDGPDSPRCRCECLG